MTEKTRIPVGSVSVVCQNCLSTKGWSLHEAITDVGRPTERYYARCLNCGHVLPLKPKECVDFQGEKVNG